MMKWFMYLSLAVLVGGSWVLYARTGDQIRQKSAEIQSVQSMGDPDSRLEKLEGELQNLDGQRILSGVMLAFVSAGIVGIFFVLHILPSMAHRLTHAIYDSGERVERDGMHAARSLLEQGQYEEAIEAFRQAAAADPLNRLPWVEIVKIYRDKLHDSAGAIETLRHALESQEWEINDAAYLLFRLAELYDEIEGYHESAVAIMQQVIDQFPGTRHSANAIHRMNEWRQAEDEAQVFGMVAEAERPAEEEVSTA